MQFMLLIYTDPALMDSLSESTADGMMRDCFAHTDVLKRDGQLYESQMLQAPSTARSVRIRDGRPSVVDGPYAEAKEVLGGFNLIEADSMEEAVQIALHFPWARTGCVEVRPVEDIEAVRQRVTRHS